MESKIWFVLLAGARQDPDNFEIIGSAKNDYQLCIKETLLIHKDNPKISTNDGSIPIYLFE